MLMASAIAADIPLAARKHHRTLTAAAHAVWGLDAPIPAFGAQVHQESGWSETAKSYVGAQGLGQFMPATGNWIVAEYPDLGPHQPFNPAWALRALVRYDRHLYDRIPAANECEQMAMALSSYNGGLGNLYRAQRLAAEGGADPFRWFGAVERFNPGRSESNYRENRFYARRILIDLQPTYGVWGRSVKCSV